MREIVAPAMWLMAASGFSVLAQESPEFDTRGLTAALSSIASVGFAVWYAWYTTTKTLPEKDRQFSEALDKKDEAFRETLDKIVSEFRIECREQRAAFRGSLPHDRGDTGSHA